MDGNTGQNLTTRPWYVVGRWQAFRGEVRANILRMMAISVFYGIHLVSAYCEQVDEASSRDPISSVILAWSFVVLLVFFCLHRKYFPPWLKYLSTVLDVILLTWIATLGAGPSSPAVVAYFVIVTISGVRMRLRLVWCATACSIAGYLFVVATAWNDWWSNGPFLVGREEVLMVIAGLAVTGIVVGQIVRCACEMTSDYVAQAEHSRKEVRA